MLQDGVEDVYMFLDDQEGASDTRVEREELPTAVITLLTRCYAPSCYDETPCYSFACPKRVSRRRMDHGPRLTLGAEQEPRLSDSH